MKHRTLLLKTRRGTYKMALWAKDADGIATLQTDPIEIQSLVFAKEKGWNVEKAVNWAQEHDFKADKVDENDTQVRLRQFEPDACQADSFASWPIEGAEGVMAVGCRKKGAEEDGFEFSDAHKRARLFQGIVRAGDVDAGEKENDVDGIASMKTVDRYQELIKPDAYRKSLEGFAEHPVMLLGHESNAQAELPIGNWRRGVTLTDDTLRAAGSLMPEHRRFTEVQASVRDRNLALSVGFIPVRGHEATDEEIAQFGSGLRFVWDEVELLEISLVSIPANRESLLAIKSAALREAETTMDVGNWQNIVRELKALEAKTASVRRKIREGQVKNWKPMVDEIKKVTNDFAAAFNEKVTALETYLEEQLGPGEEPEPDETPPEEPPPEETPPGPAPDSTEETYEALRSLKATTDRISGTN